MHRYSELSIVRVLKQVMRHKEISQYLPEFKKVTTKSVDREFLFGLVNTIDPFYFPDAMGEIEEYRLGIKAKKE